MGNFLMEMEANVRTLILIFIGLVYLFLGAAIFSAIERNHEAERKDVLMAQIEHIKAQFNMTDVEFRNVTRIALEMQPHKAGTQWSFVGALYFSITVVTTIGYGHSVPQTATGKIFCMIYATMGIPICLIMFQAMGERINNAAKFCLKKAGRKLGFQFDEISHRCLVPFGIFSCVLTVIVGTSSFAAFEGWSYVDSVYYCVMTLSTIGFGDYVALQDDGDMQERPHYVAFSLIYIMIGLTVIGAFLNLVILRMMVTLPDTPEGSTNGDHDALDRRRYRCEDDYGSSDAATSDFGSGYETEGSARGLRKSVRDCLYSEAEQGKRRRPAKLTALCRSTKRRKFERRWKRKANQCREEHGADDDSSSDETEGSECPQGGVAARSSNHNRSRLFKRRAERPRTQRRAHDEWPCAAHCLGCPCARYAHGVALHRENDDTFYKAPEAQLRDREEKGGKDKIPKFDFLAVDSDGLRGSDGYSSFVRVERHGRQVSDDSGYCANAHNATGLARSPARRRCDGEPDASADVAAVHHLLQNQNNHQHKLANHASPTAKGGTRSPSPLLSDSADPVVVYNKRGAGKTITIHQGRGKHSVGGQSKDRGDAKAPDFVEMPEMLLQRRMRVVAEGRSATPPLIRQNNFSDAPAPSIVVTTCSPKLQRACDSLSHQDSNETTVTVLTSEVEDSVFLEEQSSRDENEKQNNPAASAGLHPALCTDRSRSDSSGSGSPTWGRASAPGRNSTHIAVEATDAIVYEQCQSMCRESACPSVPATKESNCRRERAQKGGREKKAAKLKRAKKAMSFGEHERNWKQERACGDTESTGKSRSRWSIPFLQLFATTARRKTKHAPDHVMFSAVTEATTDERSGYDSTPTRKGDSNTGGKSSPRASAKSRKCISPESRRTLDAELAGVSHARASLATLEDDFDTTSMSSVTSLSSYVDRGSRRAGRPGYGDEVC